MVNRTTPAGTGPDRWWAFTGSTTGTSLTFSFYGQVRALLQRPTIRASLANGTRDQSPYYSSVGTAANSPVDYQGFQVTPDGSYAVFATAATNLHAQATSGTNVFRYDLNTGAVEVVNRSTSGTVPTGCTATLPTISDDGLRVAFQSKGCDLGFGATGTSQVYLRNIGTGTTALVSHALGSPNTAGTGDSFAPAMAGGGSHVAFTSKASDLVSGRPPGRPYEDAYRYSVGSGLVERANLRNGAPASSTAWPDYHQSRVSISHNGAYVLFDSAARLLTTVPDPAYNYDVFLFDFNALASSGTASTTKVSVQASGASTGNGTHSYFGVFSGDDNSIAFISRIGSADPALVASPSTTAGRFHVYVRSRTSPADLEMVDKSPDGAAEANAGAAFFSPALSSDGRLVAYVSIASNLKNSSGCSPGCTGNMGQMVWVYDRASTDPALQRSFMPALIQPSYKYALGFYPSTGVVYGKPSLIGNVENGFVAYAADPSGPWDQLPSPVRQLYVAPLGDPLFQ